MLACWLEPSYVFTACSFVRAFHKLFTPICVLALAAALFKTARCSQAMTESYEICLRHMFSHIIVRLCPTTLCTTKHRYTGRWG
jgi:hypothetical protein